MPLSRQRIKRRCVLLQSPKSGGKSRHGAPVRIIQNTALINSRLSFAIPPHTPLRPGKWGSNNAHVLFDIVPCVVKGNEKFICNKETNKFEKTDGTAYKKWLIEQNKKSGNNLKQVIRLMKYLRDIKRNFTCKSILLTTLLGNQIRSSESFADLPTALKEICNRLNTYLQNHGQMPIIKNPVLPSENFNRHWDEKNYDHFRKMFGLYTAKMNESFELQDHNKSVKKWREIFGEKFGELQEEKKNEFNNI